LEEQEESAQSDRNGSRACKMAFGCKPVDLDLMAFGWKLQDHGLDVHVWFGSVGGYIERELTDILVKWKNVY
jgi:hypothetical protein